VGVRWNSRRIVRAEHTLQRVLNDGDDALKLLRGEVTGALGQINIGLLADQVGVAATDTLDLGQGVHDLLLSIDVCVQQTDDVLEAVASQHCCSPCIIVKMCIVALLAGYAR
jgi:hypothetical protein